MLGSALLGCSSDVSQADFSARFARAVCDKAYQCLDPGTLESSTSVYGRTRAECATTYSAGSPLGCAPGKTLDRVAVDRCLMDVAKESCTLVKTTGAVVTPYSCTSLCPEVTGDGGAEADARPIVRRDGGTDAGDLPPEDASVDAPTPADAALDGASTDAAIITDASVD